MTRTFPTVILYSRDGYEITRSEEIEGMAQARKHARYLLSDAHAEACETTHERWRTAKVAIFAEGAETGYDRTCEWDKEHPQHRAYLQSKEGRIDALEHEQAEEIAETTRRADHGR